MPQFRTAGARVALAALATVSPAEAAYSFLSFGDWGGALLGSFHPATVKAVAQQMGATAASSNAQFVINVGDNFYYCGIQNTSDFQINADYLTQFTAPGLQVPWYGALGNHEYGYNVDAQVEYTQVDPTKRWYLPARYYTKRVELVTGTYLTMIVLDSNPCVQEYRNTDASKWDPCGSDFPTCDPVNEGECKFHENILTQDCSAQYSWFQTQLAAVPKDDWLIVVGHHPADEMNVQDFLTPMQQHGFHLYLNGHVHTLQQYSVDGNPAFVTTGAGSMVQTADQQSDERCLATASNTTLTSSLGHSYQSLWNNKVAGFTLHTFSDDFTSLKTDYISTTGEVLHSFSVTKQGGGGGGGGGQCGTSTRYPCSSGCTYVHKANQGACGVAKYGCYDCSQLSSTCPECSSILEIV